MFKRLGLKIRNKKALSRYHKKRASISFNQAKSIGLLVKDYAANKKAVDLFAQELEKEGKKVEILNFITDSDIVHNNKISNLTKKDIDWKGKLNLEKTEKFIKTDFDYLFSLHTSSFLPFENILARSKAKCRIGYFKEKKQNFYEIMLQPPQNEDLNLSSKQMLALTKNI